MAESSTTGEEAIKSGEGVRIKRSGSGVKKQTRPSRRSQSMRNPSSKPDVKRRNSIRKCVSVDPDQDQVDKNKEEEGRPEPNKYEKSRVRRRSSLGAFGVGSQPMFDFQRRHMIKSGKETEAGCSYEILEKRKYKCMVVGDSGVGKSSLVTRYSVGQWPLAWIPDVTPHPVDMEVGDIILEMWDTSGRKEYDRMRKFTFMSTKVFLVCFGCDDEASLGNALAKWLPIINEMFDDVLIVLVCLKADLLGSEDAKVTSEQGKERAEEARLPYLEHSSTESLSTLLENISKLTLNCYDKSPETATG